MSSLSVLSFNIYNYTGNIKKFSKQYNQKLLPDIICTQEDGGTYNVFGNNYTKLISNGFGGDAVAVYYNNDTVNEDDITFIRNINISSKYLSNISPRNAIIFTVKGITIVNLHLEGGRNVDKMILTNDFNSYLNYKLSLLRSILEFEPDIICGDFNSVYSCNIDLYNKYIDGQINYFESFSGGDLSHEDILKIKKWNIMPYKNLLDNNYKYIVPENPYTVTTSRGNTIIDTFWINNKFLNKLNKYNNLITEHKIIDLGDNVNNWLIDGISDHNPLYLKLSI